MRTLRLPLLGLLCGVLLPAAAMAQEPGPGMAAYPHSLDHPGPGVTFTLHGLLAPRPQGELSIPLPLLERLTREASLTALDTHPGPQGRPRFHAHFSFNDARAFMEWYQRADTRSLIADVRAATTSDSLELLVSVRRGAERAGH